MRKAPLFFLGFLFVTTIAYAQQQTSRFAVAFYNQENLFDTIHDENKNDYDFLPGGLYRWDKTKYEHKLANMSRALLDLGTDKLPGVGAAIIGMAEVENDRVMRDLTSLPAMKKRGFRYIHIEGPDARGIDCALLYNPRYFTPEKSFLKPYVYVKPEDQERATRGFLTVQGKMAGDPLTVIVCHWPSRGSAGYYRDLAGKQVRALVDSIQKADSQQRIIVMGDMNDDPDNDSMAKYLRARRKVKGVGKTDFFNPWWDILRVKKQGTLTYKGEWNLFDQIVVSRNLLDVHGTKDYSHLTLSDFHIFRRDYLFEQTGKYKGNPLRTSAGGKWLDGYSDHLPTVTYFVKEMK